MTRDRRTTPDPDWSRVSEAACVVMPVVDLCATPEGPRDRQLLFGDMVTVLGRDAEIAYVRADKDGYHGFVARTSLSAQSAAPTHRVATPGAHAYGAPDIKSRETQSFSFGSLLNGRVTGDGFLDTVQGFVPLQQLAPADSLEASPVDVARKFLGTPYLWGGNSRAGIDCSGLVQAALLACGVPCPGDSDQQMEILGTRLGPGSARTPGDLLFWKGHVGLVAENDMLLHANAHHMSTVEEPCTTALARIEAETGQGVIAHIRL